MQMVEIAKQKMLEHLPQNGRLLIGDVAFSTINDMEQCKKQAGNACGIAMKYILLLKC